MLFRNACSENTDFRQKLINEESLIRSGIDHSIPAGVFPHEILPSALKELRKAMTEKDIAESLPKNKPNQ
jgi:hypothetical protein